MDVGKNCYLVTAGLLGTTLLLGTSEYNPRVLNSIWISIYQILSAKQESKVHKGDKEID